MTESSDAGWVTIPVDLCPPNVPKERFAEFCGLHIKEKLDGAWIFKTNEDYANSAKPGIRLVLLARGSQFDHSGLHKLSLLTPITYSTSPADLEGLNLAQQNQASLRGEPEPLWSRIRGDITISLDADLEGKLRALQSEGLASDSLWLAEVDKLLSLRLAFMRLLFAQKYTTDAIETTDFAGFPAARALMVHSASGFTMYFSPMLLLDSPWVGGSAGGRPYATVIRLLTTPEPGRPIGWTDQLDSFRPTYAASRNWHASTTPRTSLEDREHVLRWWTARLSELLRIVTDPTCHRDENWNYAPDIHLGVTLTVERLFVVAIEIMCLKTKDEFLRKILLFDFLDLLQGLGMGEYTNNLGYERQFALWTSLKQSLPVEVVEAFSPNIDKAFEALSHLEKGFRSAVNRTDDNQILISRDNGIGRDSISMERARGDYLRILRNSAHGFRDLAKSPRRLSFLASHTAELDDNLADLVWWYLIRILTNPSKISSPYGDFAR